MFRIWGIAETVAECVHCVIFTISKITITVSTVTAVTIFRFCLTSLFSRDDSRLGPVPRGTHQEESSDTACAIFYTPDAVPVINQQCQSTEVLFVFLEFNGIFSTNRLYRATDVGK